MNNVAFEPVALGGPDPVTGQFNYVGVSAPTQASGTLTLSGNAVAGETFTIQGRTYTRVTTIPTAANTVPNQVLRGASAAASVTNAVAAINATAGQDGILYSFGTTPNVAVSAADGAGDTIVVTALSPQYPGAAGNIIATSEAMTNASWGAATLTGGAYGSIFSGSSSSGGAAQGNAFAVPANTTNGTELAPRPSVTSGVRFYMSATSSVTLFVAPTGSNPSGAPSVTWKVSNTSATDGAIHDEPLAGTDGLFLTASTGTVEARYVQR